MQSPYLHSLKQGFSDISFYSVDFLLGLIQAIAAVGINVFLWTYIIPSPDTQTFTNRLAYFLLANGLVSIIGAARLHYAKELREAIKTGRLSNLLLLPINPATLLFAENYGTRLPETVIGIFFLVIALFISPPPTLLNVFIFVLLIICGTIIATSINLFAGSIAFWTTEVSGINNGIIHITRLLNGTQIKLSYVTEMFGRTAGAMLYSLPFAATAFIPSYILNTRTWGTAELHMIASSIIWATIMPAIAIITWKRGLRKYEGTGT